MPYRFNSVDILVGVGLCAIVFGAMALIVATSGAFVVTGPQPGMIEEGMPSTEAAWLQPALGKAVVERSLLQQRSDQITASSTAEWNQALTAHRSLQAIPGGPFGFVMDRAVAVPQEHAARVEAVTGRAIVNFTQRGIRSGVLSADLYLSDYNQSMIAAADARARRMHDEFSSTWQAVLGRWIVEVSREYMRRTAEIQEQLGTAIVHVAQARMGLEGAWAANQYQLGSLMAAADRMPAVGDHAAMMASGDATRPEAAGSIRLPLIPDVPAGYLLAAAMVLCGVFFGGLLLSATAREAKAAAEARRHAGRWVYRMAT
ncbi:MAG TPA: hypothetical protein VL261_02045 [Nitrospira sp.]|jgi:hypothetical protein|nr:hypothetical protein [Nitrospira sp.]